jgi:hypothetical protein
MRFLFSLGAAICVSVCMAGDRDEMRQILADNFAACNEENIEALMDTCSADMPDRPGFRRESEILFQEKDLHYSLVDFEVTMVDQDYAEAWVVQATYTDDRNSDSEQRSKFRSGTTLLPQEEVVEYKVAFKYEAGKWKCYMTISEPRPYRMEKARR